jgi:hypothetical protein
MTNEIAPDQNPYADYKHVWVNPTHNPKDTIEDGTYEHPYRSLDKAMELTPAGNCFNVMGWRPIKSMSQKLFKKLSEWR